MWGATHLHNKHVVAPVDAPSLSAHAADYDLAGLNGCFGSMDATHIAMECCYHGLQNLHDGAKLPGPCRTYNIVTNNSRKILDSTSGHPGRWNDKTLVLCHDLIVKLHGGKIFQDNMFELEEHGLDGRIRKRKYKGAWVITDNGYLNWACTIPPFKEPVFKSEHDFTKWLESIRKDVECTFGILKGRFRQLKTGTRLHGIKATYRIWLTCCAMHNMLLDVDGLVEDCRNNGKSDYEGEWGQHSRETVINNLPPPMRERFLRHDDSCNLCEIDFSGVGRANDFLLDEEEGNDFPAPSFIPDPNDDSIRIVSDLERDYFRRKLVENFSIRLSRGEVMWPRSSLSASDH